MTITYFFKSYKLFKEILAVSGTLIYIPIGTTTIRKYYREFIYYLLEYLSYIYRKGKKERQKADSIIAELINCTIYTTNPSNSQ